MTRGGWLGTSVALHAAALAALVLAAPRASPPLLDFTRVQLVPPRAPFPPAAPPGLSAPRRAAARAAPRQRPPAARVRNPSPAEVAPVAVPPLEPAAAEALPAEAPGDGAEGVAGGVPGGLAGGVVGGDPLAVPEPPSERARVAWLDRHFAGIRASIQRRAAYPTLARRMGWEGRVVVGFRILADGRVAEVRVVRSSGHPALDQGALEAVVRAAPFPPPPCEADILVPVSFTLTQARGAEGRAHPAG